jgi:hypothetical protein
MKRKKERKLEVLWKQLKRQWGDGYIDGNGKFGTYKLRDVMRWLEEDYKWRR